jgi:RNA polymerase sigma-70 factor (ECF subfamily)
MTRAEQTDAELVARCRAGDEQAWRDFVERFSRYVYAITVQAYRLREHDAEDVFQDVFARVFERLDDLRDDSAVRPWLAQMTRRLCVDKLRAGAREGPAADEELESSEVDETLDRIDEAVGVHEALAELPEQCGEILDRFFARDQSYRTIGDELELPSGTVASRISRCLEKLKELLEGRKQAAAPSRGRR